MAGVPYDLFWGDITPKVFRKFIGAHNKRIQEQDMLNHMLGQYIGTAVNNGTKYPKQPYLSESNQPKMMSFDEYENLVRIKYGKKK